MSASTRIPTRLGMIPNLQPIILPPEGGLTVPQLAQHFSAITDAINYIIRAVNGRITFGDSTQSSQSGNIDGQIKTVYFAEADTDVLVPHGLGRTPIGIIVLAVDTEGAQAAPFGGGFGSAGAIGTVVRGASEGSWGPTRLYVRCNVALTTARFVVV